VEVSRTTLAEVFGRNPRSPTMPQPFALEHPEPEVHVKGDPLGRSYTPDPVALAIMLRLRLFLPQNPTVLEPCVGGGAFVRAAHRALFTRYVVGVDIDPLAPGRHDCHEFVVQDFAKVRWTPNAVDLSVTNPPFGRAVGQDVTLAIVQNALDAAGACAVLVPLDYITQVGWAELVALCVEVWPIVGRVWDHERGMVVLVWCRAHYERWGVNRAPTLHIPLTVSS
jgi:predicted RNA methylase